MISPRRGNAAPENRTASGEDLQKVDVDTLRNEYEKMHSTRTSSVPKRVVDVEVSPLTAPDAHTWLQALEKEIVRMRDKFGRKTNQPAPPQMVAYADARFCQMTAIPQLHIHGCTRDIRRNGIVVARQLSKARRLNDQGKRSKGDEKQTSGAKMCEDISNLLLSVGIHDEAELSALHKKLKIMKVKSLIKLKAKALSAFTAGKRAAAHRPFEMEQTDTAAEKAKELEMGGEEQDGHKSEAAKKDPDIKDSPSGEEKGHEQSAEGRAEREEDPEAPTVKMEARKDEGMLHNVMHKLHLTDSTRGKSDVPVLDLPISVKKGGGVNDSDDPVMSPRTLLASRGPDSDDEDAYTESEYAEVAYSSDESVEKDTLKGVDSDEEGETSADALSRRRASRKSSRKSHKGNVLKRMQKAFQQGHQDEGEDNELATPFKPRVIGGADDDDDDDKEDIGEAGKLVPHLDVFTMTPEDILWEEELAHLYLEAGKKEKIAQVEDILQANRGGELEFLQHIAEKYADALPLEQRIRVQNLEFILKRPGREGIDLKLELLQLYECVNKPELKKDADKVLESFKARPLDLIQTHFSEYTHVLPPDSQEIQRVECLRMLFLPPGMVPHPLNRGTHRKFLFGARKTRIHDINHALYVKSDEIDWKGELTHLYLVIGKPDKVKSLDEIIDANKGTEIVLLQRFQEKYEERLPHEEVVRLRSLMFIVRKPLVAWTPGMVDWKAELATLYIAAGKGEKLDVLEDIVEANKGAEGELLLRLVDKYQEVLPKPLVTRLRALKEIAGKKENVSRLKDVNWKAELAAFYLAINKPEKLDYLDSILEDNKGAEGDLFAHFCDKYRNDIPEAMMGHLLNLGQMIERDRLGQAFLDTYDDLQLVGYQYDVNKSMDGHEAVHVIDLSLNRIRFLDFSQRMTWSVDHVVALNLSGNLLVSLQGIESCTHLRFLNCSDNLLTNMYALRGCLRLRHLKISGNSLTSLSFLTPQELDEAHDPEEHSKAMLSTRRGTKGAFRSRRAASFFQTQFGGDGVGTGGEGGGSGGAAGRRASVISPRASPRLLQAMLNAAKMRGIGGQSSKGPGGATDSTFPYYDEPEEIEWDKELSTFYMAAGLDDKLANIPEIISTHTTLESQAHMMHILHDKYQPVEGGGAEGGDDEAGGDGSDGLGHLAPPENLNRLLTLSALAESRHAYGEADHIDWEAELTHFYQACGLFDKAKIVGRILKLHSGREEHLVTVILSKYGALSSDEGDVGKVDTTNYEDDGDGGGDAAGVRVPACARRRFHALGEQLRKHKDDAQAAQNQEKAAVAEAALAEAKRSKRGSFFSSFRFSRADNDKAGAKEVVDSPDPSPRPTPSAGAGASSKSGAPASAAAPAVGDSSALDNVGVVSPAALATSQSTSTLATTTTATSGHHSQGGNDNPAAGITTDNNSPTGSEGSPSPAQRKMTRFADSVTGVAGLGGAGGGEHTGADGPGGTDKKLFDLPHLEYLNASENSTLQSLHGLRYYSHLSLTHLELRQCNLRDEHLVELVDLPLSTVHLDNNHISSLEQSLDYLKTLGNLKNLSLMGNPVQAGEGAAASSSSSNSASGEGPGPEDGGVNSTAGTIPTGSRTGGTGASVGVGGRAQDKQETAHGFASRLIKEGSASSNFSGLTSDSEPNYNRSSDDGGGGNTDRETAGASPLRTAQKRPSPSPVVANINNDGDDGDGNNDGDDDDDGGGDDGDGGLAHTKINQEKFPHHAQLQQDALALGSTLSSAVIDAEEGGKGKGKGRGSSESSRAVSVRRETSQTSQLSALSGASSGGGDVEKEEGKKSLYSIAILDSIDTLETLDHLVVPPALYYQLRRMKAQVEGEGVLRDIERYYADEMLSMEDVHKNLAQKHRRSESLIKAIVKDKTVRVEEEMSALLKYSRAKLLTLRSTGQHGGGAGAASYAMYDRGSTRFDDPREVLSTVTSEFNSKKRQREADKKRAAEAREAREAEELAKKQRTHKAMMTNPLNMTSSISSIRKGKGRGGGTDVPVERGLEASGASIKDKEG